MDGRARSYFNAQGNPLAPFFSAEAERDQLIAELTAAINVAEGRAGVLFKVAEKATLRINESNRAFVLTQYYGYLRRNPDDPQDSDFRGWEFAKQTQ